MPLFGQCTSDEIEEILAEIVGELSPAQILSTPGVRDALAEDLHNDVLDRWAERNPDKAEPEDSETMAEFQAELLSWDEIKEPSNRAVLIARGPVTETMPDKVFKLTDPSGKFLHGALAFWDATCNARVVFVVAADPDCYVRPAYEDVPYEPEQAVEIKNAEHPEDALVRAIKKVRIW